MDPNAKLEEMLKLAKAEVDKAWSRMAQAAPAARLAELVMDLDEWLSKGGFLPKKWERCAACVAADLTPDLCEHSRGEG